MDLMEPVGERPTTGSPWTRPSYLVRRSWDSLTRSCRSRDWASSNSVDLS